MPKLHQCFYDFEQACRSLGHGEITGLRIQNGLLCQTRALDVKSNPYRVHGAIVNFAATVRDIEDGSVDVKVRQGLPVLVECTVEFPFAAGTVIKKIDVETGTSKRKLQRL